MTKHALHDAKCPVASILYGITMVQRLVSEEREQRSNTINLPPCTVFIILAKRFNARASKSRAQLISRGHEQQVKKLCTCRTCRELDFRTGIG